MPAYSFELHMQSLVFIDQRTCQDELLSMHHIDATETLMKMKRFFYGEHRLMFFFLF